MAFQIVSTRNGVSPVTGSYRDDLAQGDLVGLALSSMVGVTQVRWELRGRPEGSAAGGAGPEPVLLANAPTASFTVDADAGSFRLDGSYTVQATINPGSPGEFRVTAILARVSGLTIPGPSSTVRTLRKLGGFEALEDVSVTTVLQGWAMEMNRWLELVRETVTGGGPTDHTTLAGAYGHGASSSDQTLVLDDALGGGVVIDATQPGFTGAIALRVNTVAGGPVVIDRATGRVGVGIAAPLQAVHAKGSAPALRLDRTSGAALDVQNVNDDLQFLNGATVLGKLLSTGGFRSDFGIATGTDPAGHPVASLGAASTAPVSNAGEARFRYNEIAVAAEFSIDGGPWQPFAPAQSAYRTVQAAGTPLTQRTVLNFIAPLSPVDNGGATRTDVSIATNGVSSALFRQSVAFAVVGNPTNATANVQDIVASTPSTFLGLNAGGTALAFSTVPSGAVSGTANTVPFFNGTGALAEATNALSYDPTNVRLGSRISSGLPLYQIHLLDEAGAADRGLTAATYQNGTAGPLLTMQAAQGTYASPTAVDATKYGGLLSWQFYGGSSFIETARMFTHVTPGSTITTTSVPTDIVLQNNFGAAVTDAYAGVGLRLPLILRAGAVVIAANPLATFPAFSFVVASTGGLFNFGVTNGATYNPANFGTTGYQFNNISQLLMMSNINGTRTPGTATTSFRFAGSRGTNAAPTAVVPGDQIGGNGFYGYDGTSYTPTHSVTSFVDFNSTVTTGNVPSNWGVFVGDGSGLPGLLHSYADDVVAGNWSQLTAISRQGFFWAASMAGVPTGTPIVPQINSNPVTITTAVPLVPDTTHGRLYAYFGHWAPVGQDTTAMSTGYLRSTAVTGVWSTVTTIPASDLTGLFYQTVASAGAAVTQRPLLNFAAPLTAVDNAGATRTDVSLTIDSTLVVAAGALGRAAISGDGAIAAASNTFTLTNIPTGTTAAGTINFAGVAAPASPASGHGLLYFDSTSLNIAVKNAAGAINHGIRTNPGATHEWVSAINDDGTVVLTQPAAADITGLFYQTVQAAGSSLTQRPLLNFTARFSAVDNSGATRTDVDLAASGVTAGTYSLATVTVDVFGRVTAASAGSTGTVTDVGATLPLTSTHGATPTIALNYDAASIALNGSNQIQVAAFTGDVTRAAGGTVTTLANIPSDVPMAGDLLATAIAAPAVPAAGKVRIYVDSTSLNLAAKTAAGVVNHGVRTAGPVGHQWVDAIADDGTVSLSQPAYSDISGTPTLFYQTIQAATSPLTQRPAWNAAFGLTAADNSGSNRTDLTVNLTTGISGGQAAIGDTAASGVLTLQSTASATRGYIKLGNVAGPNNVSIYDETNATLSIGDSSLSALSNGIKLQTYATVAGFSGMVAVNDAGVATTSRTGFYASLVKASVAGPSFGFLQNGLAFSGSAGFTDAQGGLIQLISTSGAPAINLNNAGTSGGGGDFVFTTGAVTSPRMRIVNGGTVEVVSLGGVGVRMVSADANGGLGIGTPGVDYLVQAYTTVDQAGSALSQRSVLNFTSDFSAVDNSGSSRTDVSLANVGPGAGTMTGVLASIGLDARGRVTSIGTASLVGLLFSGGTLFANVIGTIQIGGFFSSLGSALTWIGVGENDTSTSAIEYPVVKLIALGASQVYFDINVGSISGVGPGGYNISITMDGVVQTTSGGITATGLYTLGPISLSGGHKIGLRLSNAGGTTTDIRATGVFS